MVLKPKPKRKGRGLEIKTFIGKSSSVYIVYKTKGGSFHVFQEVEAKRAGRDCGGKGRNTREIWKKVWEQGE